MSTYAKVDKELFNIIAGGCVRIIDAKMIIEDDLHLVKDERKIPPPEFKMPLGDLTESYAIEEVVKTIRREGLGPHILRLIGLFGSVTLKLTGTKEQQELVEKWINNRLTGCFLMTDNGGPNLKNWESIVTIENGIMKLTVNKIHGMGADSMDFSMIVAIQKGSLIPMTYLIDPERTSKLVKSPIGDAWLDGNLKLGNVKGEIIVTKEDQLRLGGLSSVNKFLTFCRPRLIKSIIAHVQYLSENKRANLKDYQLSALENMAVLTDKYLERNYFTKDSVDEVQALKFANNELMLDLVVSESVNDPKDQRDLLGFTKMEGSSYRCYYEIHNRRRVKK